MTKRFEEKGFWERARISRYRASPSAAGPSRCGGPCRHRCLAPLRPPCRRRGPHGRCGCTEQPLGHTLGRLIVRVPGPGFGGKFWAGFGCKAGAKGPKTGPRLPGFWSVRTSFTAKLGPKSPARRAEVLITKQPKVAGFTRGPRLYRGTAAIPGFLGAALVLAGGENLVCRRSSRIRSWHKSPTVLDT